jgi:hypothetical protein
MHRNQTKQALANLSGKPVNDISMARLAPMFAKTVVNRRRAELQSEFEESVPKVFIDHLRAKASKLLEKEAENTGSNLPVSSVFDALQIVKQSKLAATDAGVRAWKGMLESMWKKNRTANITAESFMRFRDYFTSNFPKSAVSEVFEEIGAKGYAALPISDLLRIASRIHSQEDFEYEIMKAGLMTKQPHHVKARNFILAAVNGDLEEEDEDSYGMEAADWLVNRIKFDGTDEDFRKKTPPPRRKDVKARKRAAQGEYLGNHGDVNWLEYGGRLVFTGPHGPYMYVVEPWGAETSEVDDIRDPNMTWLVYQVQLDKYQFENGKLVDEFGHVPWFERYIDSISSVAGADPQEFIKLITSDSPDDLADAYDMIGAYSGWDEFDEQHYLNATEMKRWFGDLIEEGEIDPLPDFDENDDFGIEARKRAMGVYEESGMVSPPDDGALLESLSQWHSGMGDPIYQLSSHWFAGHPVGIETVEKALSGLKGLSNDPNLSEEEYASLIETIQGVEDAVYSGEHFDDFLGVEASRKRADFMEPQVEYGKWALVEDDEESHWIPGECANDAWVIGPTGKVVEIRMGWGAHYSAPGYLDQTEWEVFDTQEEAEAYLEEMYGDEDFDDEDFDVEASRN